MSKAKPKDYKTMVVLQKGGGYGRFFLSLFLSSKTFLPEVVVSGFPFLPYELNQ
jgi:hypothetical protein